jgi:hypothetical protein
MIIILHVFDEMGLRFFVARWVPYRPSPELKAKRIKICREMLKVLEQLDPWQKIMLLHGMNAGFTRMIITANNI